MTTIPYRAAPAMYNNISWPHGGQGLPQPACFPFSSTRGDKQSGWPPDVVAGYCDAQNGWPPDVVAGYCDAQRGWRHDTDAGYCDAQSGWLHHTDATPSLSFSPQMKKKRVMTQYAAGTAFIPPLVAPGIQHRASTLQPVPNNSSSPTLPVGFPSYDDGHEQHRIKNVGRQAVRAAQIPWPSTGFYPHPTANSKTITYNETINPADKVNFETGIDELMKVIQKRKLDATLEASCGPTPAYTPRADISKPSIPRGAATTPAESKPKKNWACDGPGCNKSFVRKTLLDIHHRTHSGAKPYLCPMENCRLAFSQRGNLKTHIRRHTGEKPFHCCICGKAFAQRGNVRSHEETHKGMKPFVCKLDNCNQTFSRLGNMKTHQNKFHKELIKSLTQVYVSFHGINQIPKEERELFEYFEEYYKNSNKGVKGRGKAHYVTARKPKSQP